MERTNADLSETEGVARDALFGGRVELVQPSRGRGYRVNVDALLLAAFSGAERRIKLAVDLGAGVGAVGLTLLHLGVAERVEFVERDPTLVELCQHNLAANQLTARGAAREGDLERSLRSIAPDLMHEASLVVANPPYFSPGRDGRSRGESQLSPRLAARHGDLAPFVRAAADALGRRGRACFVYPAPALLDLTTRARALGLEPKRLRFVHGRADRPARVALVELTFGKPGGLVVLPPLVETSADGRATPEIAELLARA